MQVSWVSALIFACAHGGALAAKSEATAKCMNASLSDIENSNASADAKKCAKHIKWAMNDGLKTQPEWYQNYTVSGAAITNKSSFDSFQCMEWLKSTREDKTDGHGCMKPCKPAPVTFRGTVYCAGTESTTNGAKTESKPKGGGMPWWGWALIIVGGLCVLGGLAYAFMGGKKPEKKKKKRAAKAPQVSAAAAAPVPTPVATTAIPMPVYTTYQTAPVTTAVAPSQYVSAAPTQSVSYAAPVTYAAPAASVSFAAPVAYAAPVTYAAPVAAAATAFDMIDTNHDGVISRQELGAAMR